MTWWIRLFVLSIVVLAIVDAPRWLGWLIMLSLFALAMVRPPADDDREPVVVAAPVRGRWVALNSPASRVPSHGIRAYGQSHAIDILHPRPPGSGRRVGWGLGMRPPAVFSSFGQPVLAVADGVVVRASDRQRDHRSRESWASLAYLFVVEGFFREVAGPPFILGNHLVVDHGDGSYSTDAHLRRGSLRVSAGDEVHTGQQLAEVGNSGNTTEPHLHPQVMDDPGSRLRPACRFDGPTSRSHDRSRPD